MESESETTNRIRIALFQNTPQYVGLDRVESIDTGIYRAYLRGEVKRIIDLDDRRVIKVQHFNDIGTIDFRVEKSGRIVPTGSVDVLALETSLRTRQENMMTRLEEMVIRASAPSLVDLPHARTYLHRIRDAVTKLRAHHRISEDMLAKKRNGNKYLALMHELGFLRKEGDHYVSGVHFIELEQDLKKENKDMQSADINMKITRVIVESLIAERYEILESHLHLHQLQPFIEILDSYIYPCLAVDQVIGMTLETIENYYEIIKHKKARNLLVQIDELVNVDLFHQKDGKYFGDPVFFKTVKDSITASGMAI